MYQSLIDAKIAKPGDPLPSVLPIVLYNGEQRWTAPVALSDLMADCPAELAAYRPSMRFFLLEEHAQDDAELAAAENLAALVFRFEKCRTPADFRKVVEALVHFAARPEQQSAVQRMLRWVTAILWQGRLPGEPEPDWSDIQEWGKMLKERIKQWEPELIEQGVERGRQQGRTEGEAELLTHQLERKFGSCPEAFRRRIAAADSSQLLDWADRLISAETIEQVFQD